MTIRYAVTFEFPTRPPLTHRGWVTASQVGTCARKALEEAQAILRPRQWSSCVFVALERSGVGESETEDGAEGNTGEETAALSGVGA